MVSGIYFRDLIRSTRRIEAQQQTIDQRLAGVEQNAAQLPALENRIHTRLNQMEEHLIAATLPPPNELSNRTIGPLNFDRTHLGFRSRSGVWVNDPIVLEYSPDGVRWWFTNERIVEIPFTFQAIMEVPPPARVVDIGACESLVALELASLGYTVTAVDIRPYTYIHPNLTAVTASILDWEGDGRPYDVAVLLSTVEHFGLPVYGQTAFDQEADKRAMRKIHDLLKPGGLLILTTPFGKSDVGETQRVYSPADLIPLLEGFRVQRCRIARRKDDKTWLTSEDISFDALEQHESGCDNEAVILATAVRI